MTNPPDFSHSPLKLFLANKNYKETDLWHFYYFEILGVKRSESDEKDKSWMDDFQFSFKYCQNLTRTINQVYHTSSISAGPESLVNYFQKGALLGQKSKYSLLKRDSRIIWIKYITKHKGF